MLRPRERLISQRAPDLLDVKMGAFGTGGRSGSGLSRASPREAQEGQVPKRPVRASSGYCASTRCSRARSVSLRRVENRMSSIRVVPSASGTITR